MTELKRLLKGGIMNFKRGGLVSFAAVLNLAITLSVVTAIILLQAILYSSLDTIKNKVDVTIYFNVGVDRDKITALKESISKLPEVAAVTYTTGEEVNRLYRERHANEYSEIQALDEIKQNPFGDQLNIKAKEVSQYETVANFLKSDDALALNSSSIIHRIDYFKNKPVIDRLNSIISGAQKLGFFVTLILIVISIINTFNTIWLTIFISKEEIGVMRLVGASKMRVHGPFMVEGAICGIIATLVTMAIFWPSTAWLGKNMTNFLGMNMYEYYVSNFTQIFTIILLSGIMLGIISSFLAVTKYLNR